MTAPQPRRRWPTLLRFAAFITLTGAIIAVIGTQLARVSLSGGGYRLAATFDDASGLSKGDQVKIAGTPVGRVERVSVDNGRARVAFTVDEQVRLPADSEVAIRWRNAVGHRVLYLIPGTSPESLRAGAHLTRTRSVVDIGELVNQIAPLTQRLDTDQINQLLTAFGQALEGNEGNLPRLVANIDALTSTIATRRQTLGQMLKDYSAVTAIIARRDKQIGRLTDDLVVLTRAFFDNRGLLGDALTQLTAMVGSTDKLLGRNADELGRLVEQMSVIAGGARRNDAILADLLKSAPPRFKDIFTLTRRGHFFEAGGVCAALGPPPCPYTLPDAKSGGMRIDSGKNLRRLIVGDS